MLFSIGHVSVPSASQSGSPFTIKNVFISPCHLKNNVAVVGDRSDTKLERLSVVNLQRATARDSESGYGGSSIHLNRAA